MTQTTPTPNLLTRLLSRHAPPTDVGPAGSLYLGLHVPAPGPLGRIVHTAAQARYSTRPHLLAIGAGGQDLDLASTLLHPQVYRALTRGEQVIGIGHPPAEVSARLRLARALGRRAAVTCLPSDAARALPLLAEHPDVSLLMRGMRGGVPDGLPLPADRVIHAWRDADLIEVLTFVPGNPVRSGEGLLQEWLCVRGRQAPPALVHIDVPGGRLAAGALADICDVARTRRVQVVLHGMAWLQITAVLGDQRARALQNQVSAVLMTPEQHQEMLSSKLSGASAGRALKTDDITPGSEPGWRRWARTSTAEDEHRLTRAAEAPFAAVLTGPDRIEVLHLPPLHWSSFPVDRQGDRLATQPDVPPCLQPRSGVTPRS